ncbi:hypothetical protein G9A89_020929 [Geosiphon pyriformis]|nr:hypothetical protein G9A89_020929 [Geosiphon pyriformis]
MIYMLRPFLKIKVNISVINAWGKHYGSSLVKRKLNFDDMGLFFLLILRALRGEKNLKRSHIAHFVKRGHFWINAEMRMDSLISTTECFHRRSKAIFRCRSQYFRSSSLSKRFKFSWCQRFAVYETGCVLLLKFLDRIHDVLDIFHLILRIKALLLQSKQILEALIREAIPLSSLNTLRAQSESWTITDSRTSRITKRPNRRIIVGSCVMEGVQTDLSFLKTK